MTTPEIEIAPAMARELREHALRCESVADAARMTIAAQMIDKLYGLLLMGEQDERGCLRTIRCKHKAINAAKIRRAVAELESRRTNDPGVLEVLLYLNELARKIDEAFGAGKVVRLKPRAVSAPRSVPHGCLNELARKIDEAFGAGKVVRLKPRAVSAPRSVPHG